MSGCELVRFQSRVTSRYTGVLLLAGKAPVKSDIKVDTLVCLLCEGCCPRHLTFSLQFASLFAFSLGLLGDSLNIVLGQTCLSTSEKDYFTSGMFL